MVENLENLKEGLLFTGMNIPKTLKDVIDHGIVKMEEENGEKAPQAYLDIVDSIIGTLENILNDLSADDNSVIVHCPNMEHPEELTYDALVEMFPESVTYFKED